MSSETLNLHKGLDIDFRPGGFFLIQFFDINSSQINTKVEFTIRKKKNSKFSQIFLVPKSKKKGQNLWK